MTTTRVEVHPDGSTLATAVAGELLKRLTEAQADGSTPHVGLTGGTIAERIHAELGRLGPGSDVDWARVQVWWGDERFVAPDSDDRNAGSARAAFLDVVGVPAEHVHEMASTSDAVDVEAGAAAYGAALRELGSGGFEVLMLGLGPDAHVASLFPGYPQVGVDDRAAVAVTDSPKPPPERISLTLPALNRSRSVWFLVSGDGKAEAVSRALSGDEPDLSPSDVPAIGVHGTTDTVWFLDKPAASLL